MFEQSLLESTPFQQTRSRWPAVLSVCVQAAVVATLLALPLMHPEVLQRLPLTAPHLIRLSLPTPPRPPLPQPIRVLATLATSAASAPAPATNAPVIHTTGQLVDEPALPLGTTIGPVSANPSTLFGSGAANGPRVTVGTGAGVETRNSTGKGLLTLSSGVITGLLLEPIRPAYPQIARIMRAEGTVVIQAIISKSGRIESAHVLSGPTVLQASALQAVRDARYTPYLLNHEPTEVETTISIVFRLGS